MGETLNSAVKLQLMELLHCLFPQIVSCVVTLTLVLTKQLKNERLCSAANELWSVSCQCECMDCSAMTKVNQIG